MTRCHSVARHRGRNHARVALECRPLSSDARGTCVALAFETERGKDWTMDVMPRRDGRHHTAADSVTGAVGTTGSQDHAAGASAAEDHRASQGVRRLRQSAHERRAGARGAPWDVSADDIELTW